MLRIAIILVIICIIWRWAFGKWPWEGLGGRTTRGQAIFQARKLLRVEEGASREQIIAAHKRLVAMVHPDKGGSNAAVHEANDARDLLLEELPNQGADIGKDD
ncbi:molecular chaperone DnaJ [Erythrobacter sp. THAF29]|uniref:molecular chaperone DnaJ n=1 Tax=Erythrobacter sp. THAF29 TaxID=2587851 RepID=UPI001268C654|nr:molecular chaperone DnaJ [Erythrobacter sp. THAF29]QFT76198.1 DnaJ domain protein [Erythrobacter sp. THAF29]